MSQKRSRIISRESRVIRSVFGSTGTIPVNSVRMATLSGGSMRRSNCSSNSPSMISACDSMASMSRDLRSALAAAMATSRSSSDRSSSISTLTSAPRIKSSKAILSRRSRTSCPISISSSIRDTKSSTKAVSMAPSPNNSCKIGSDHEGSPGVTLTSKNPVPEPVRISAGGSTKSFFACLSN